MSDLTEGTGIDITHTPDEGSNATITLDLTEVGFGGGANRLITDDGDGTVSTEDNLTFNGTFLDFNDSRIRHNNATFGTYDWENYQQDDGTLIWAISGTGGPEVTLYADGADYNTTFLQLGNKIRFATNGNSYINTSNNVGIGTNSPSYKLDVSGNVRFTSDLRNEARLLNSVGSAASPSYSFFSQGNAGMYRSGDGVGFSAAGSSVYDINSTRMYINTNVGIGTVSPDGKLNIDVNTSAAAGQNDDASNYSFVLNCTSGSSTGHIERHIGFRDPGGDVVSAINAVDDGGSGATGITFATGNVTTLSERMRIDSSGNVGIGVVSPGSALEVNGVIESNTSDGLGYFRLDVSGTNKAIVGLEPAVGGGSANDLSIYSRTGNLRFWANGTERLVLDTSGNLSLDATKKLYLDGGGSTYIAETAGDLVDMVVGGVTLMRFEESGTDSVFTNDNVQLGVGVHKDFVMYHNGTHNYAKLVNGNLYFTDELNNNILIVYREGGGIQLAEGDLKIPATSKLYLDGGSDTYIYEAGANVIDFVTAGSRTMQMANTYAYTEDNVLLGVGGDVNFYMKHDGTNSLLQNSTGDLTIKTTASNEDMIFSVNDGGSQINAIYIDSSNNGMVKLQNDLQYLTFGSGDDGILYSYEDDFYIQNQTQDQDIKFRVNDGGVHTDALFIQGSTTNVGIGNISPAEKLDVDGRVQIRNSSFLPSSPTNAATLHTVSGEMYVEDSGGNTTQISPHNFSLIPGGASEKRAWSYYSQKYIKDDEGNVTATQKVNVDMMKLARLVEQLTGEKLVYTEED
jgi:hypothetical protein